nr:hypothetical protein B0A51_14769 [Rachicladosporium sp. CCFEE 5018]
MQKIYFVFGPEGSFFFAGAKGSESAGLPPDVETRIATAVSVVNIALSDRGEDKDPVAFVAYEKSDGRKWWSWRSNSFILAFKENIKEFENIGQGNCRFVFGERGHYLVWTARGKWLWECPREMLPKDPIFNKQVEIDHASLGVDDSYFIIAKNGKCWWKTKGHYPALQAILDDVRPGDVIFAALNPFRIGQFFILFANNTAVFQVPLSYRSKLESALKKHGITCTALTSQQAEKKVKMPKAAKQSDFAKRLLKDITGPVAGAVISGITSALMVKIPKGRLSGLSKHEVHPIYEFSGQIVSEGGGEEKENGQESVRSLNGTSNAQSHL